MRDVLNHGTLTDKQRVLILLTALAASQTLAPMQRYAKAALGRGVKPESHAFTG